jgi:hypothetical protein
MPGYVVGSGGSGLEGCRLEGTESRAGFCCVLTKSLTVQQGTSVTHGDTNSEVSSGLLESLSLSVLDCHLRSYYLL